MRISLGGIFHAQIVLRDATLRRNHFDRAGVRELIHLAIRAGHTDIAKANSIRQSSDGSSIASKKMPAVRGIELAIPFQV